MYVAGWKEAGELAPPLYYGQQLTCMSIYLSVLSKLPSVCVYIYMCPSPIV